MALSPGTRIGVYEVLASLGAGGMGEVYRARDSKLGRDVALKVLPEAFAADPDRLARFRREAQVLGALNHPHLAAIHGLDESGGTPALVLELVEGPTLADRLRHGALPLDEALAIARQVAEALEAAHEQGIIHRDLKPANIKVREDGTAKVLDFGLGKFVEGGASTASRSPALSQSPTLTSPALMTGAGVILGTAAYMAPEQAKGKPADKRSDIWAFGCVLYEMLTGRRPFEGEDVSDTLAAVLRADVDWTTLPAEVSPAIRTLLRRCLEKDRRRRITDLAAVLFTIDEQASLGSALAPAGAGWVARDDADAHTQSALSAAERALAASSRRRLVLASAAALAIGAAVASGGAWIALRNSGPPPSPLRMSVELGANLTLALEGAGTTLMVGGTAALSPDGSTLVFVARPTDQGAATVAPRLYLRRLDQLEPVPLAGTDGAFAPFFSPDGQWVAFFAGNALKKVAVSGGTPLTLCDATNGRGGTWADDDTIVFAILGRAPLLRVPSAGGQPEPLAKLADDEAPPRWPQALPGGRGVLFTALATAAPAAGLAPYDDGNIVVQTPGGERKTVHRGGYYARYVRSGHVVFLREGTLYAAPFDLDRLELVGEPVPVVEGVAGNTISGGGQLTVSDAGAMAYLSGTGGQALMETPVQWMTRTGLTTPLRGAAATWVAPRFAPDGRRLALAISTGGATDLWVYEWERDTLTRLTFDPGTENGPVWSPDGRRVAFGSNRTGPFNLYWRNADGTGEEQRLTESATAQLPDSWHPSGRFLAFHEGGPPGKSDIMILPFEGDETSGWKPGQPTVFLTDSFRKVNSAFSPDGRWLAYASNESGRYEVYVRPFPGPGGKWQVSSGGGTDPRWSGTRRELLYRTLGTNEGTQVMSAAYSAEANSFRVERPVAWSPARFSGNFTMNNVGPAWDLHPDGDRLAVVPLPAVQAPVVRDTLVFVFNFLDELRRLAPATR